MPHPATRALLLSASIVLASCAAPMPPATQVQPVTDTLHGHPVTDNYRWLESLEKDSPAVKQWTDQQLSFTRATLDKLPCRGDLSSRFSKLMTIDSYGLPRMRGDRYFYAERTGSMNQPVVRLRGTFDGQPETILNPNAMDAKGLVSLDWWQPNWMGTLVAYGTSFAGSEMSVLKVLNPITGKTLPDTIEGKVDFGGWNAEGTGFVYSRLTDSKDPYSRVVAWHELGSPVEKDRVIIKQEDPERVPAAAVTRDGKWLCIVVSNGWGKNDLSAASLDSFLKTGTLTPVVVAKDIPAAFEPVDSVGSTLYITTTLDAPKSKLVAVDLGHPERSNWKTIVPESKDQVLDAVAMAKGMFVATYSKDVCTKIERFRLDGTSIGPVALPGLGSAAISVEDDRTEAFLSFASYNSPRTIYRLDLNAVSTQLTRWAGPTVPAKLDDIVVRQIWATSKDGTKVPAFVVTKQSTQMNGMNPTVLYGYGGFTVSLTPEFIPSIVPFLEDGGIYVVANLRGGSEFGEEWHKAGMLGNKQNVFDDLYAVAERLIADKFTDSNHLVVMGGSNGGLLTGVAVTQRPDLWTAVVCQVPLLDMLRYDQFLLAKYWVPEYGTASKPEDYAWLSAYSPYQHVKAGTKYPAVLFTAGENDSRVHPLHARKMAALMQASTASDPAIEPILLYVDRDAGHGQGKPLAARIKEAVDQWSFIMWQTGLCR